MPVDSEDQPSQCLYSAPVSLQWQTYTKHNTNSNSHAVMDPGFGDLPRGGQTMVNKSL